MSGKSERIVRYGQEEKHREIRRTKRMRAHERAKAVQEHSKEEKAKKVLKRGGALVAVIGLGMWVATTAWSNIHQAHFTLQEKLADTQGVQYAWTGVGLCIAGLILYGASSAIARKIGKKS